MLPANLLLLLLLLPLAVAAMIVLSQAEEKWVIFLTGMLTRVYRIQGLANQMLSCPAGRHQTDFVIMSRIFRESVERVNQTHRDAHSEAGTVPNRRPDFLTMMADLWSPDGWRRNIAAPPWAKRYDQCSNVENSTFYRNKCRAIDCPPAITCCYKVVPTGGRRVGFRPSNDGNEHPSSCRSGILHSCSTASLHPGTHSRW